MSCRHCIINDGIITCNNHTIIDFNNREIIYEGDIKNNMANGIGKGTYTGYYFTGEFNDIRKFNVMFEGVIYDGHCLEHNP